MVQYVITPWQDRQELLMVRNQLYPTGDATSWSLQLFENDDSQRDDLDRRHMAAHHVDMWVHRGGCPHMIESTAALAQAVLADRRSNDATSMDGVTAKMAYATAFSRFVTGLLDGQQDKQRKQSMYSLAKTIGLPATFVELRHEATHEQLPSTRKLRGAAIKALGWIWEQYWGLLDDRGYEPGAENASEAAVLGFLRRRKRSRNQAAGEPEPLSGPALSELTGRWSVNQLLQCVDDLRERLGGDLEYTELAEELSKRAGGDRHPQSNGPWSVYQGTWKPRPIGEL